MRNYKCISNESFSLKEFRLVPLRHEDRYEIMKWRNEQIYHLRQSHPLTTEQQDHYFNTVISQLFEAEHPGQLLFSMLENDTVIAYGGLVHINWTDLNAEVSFIMDTGLEKSRFEELWSIYLHLLDKIAFQEVRLHKIFTYAFDIRPHLYPVLEKCGFKQEAKLADHCLFNGEFKDVLIHAKFAAHTDLYLRKTASSDADLLFNWSNDPSVRQNSLSTEEIPYDTHVKWLDSQLKSPDSHLFILTSGKEDLGQARIQLKDHLWEIGYSIDAHHRGKKLGLTIITLLLEKFPELTFRAIVKNDNAASLKVFESLGFEITETNNPDVTVFIKNNNHENRPV